MRIGEVIGSLTLSRTHPSLTGVQWKIVVPLSQDEIRDKKPGKAEELIVYDEFSAGIGEWIAFSEGGEAAMPFAPNFKPIDAYNAAILDSVTCD